MGNPIDAEVLFLRSPDGEDWFGIECETCGKLYEVNARPSTSIVFMVKTAEALRAHRCLH